jgi:hypothetical protein
MINKELFDFITRGNIEKSLYTTSIFLIENSKIEVLEDTLIDICAYIGTFINIKEIVKLNDIILSTKYLIENDNLNIADYFIVVTKMCILCNIYNKNPVSKTGVIPIGKLREKIIDVFSEEFKLSSNGIMKFEMIIPPTDSEAYILSIKIISSFVRIIKILDNLSSENANAIELISLKLKNCFDYIIRKKYIIQTKLNPSEHDPIYFLWGFIEILYNHEDFIHGYYWLFSNNYSKKVKKNKIGLIYGCVVAIIYSYKRFISTNWNQNELNVINKTKEISIDLIKQVKTDLKSKNLYKEETKKDIVINNNETSINNNQKLSLFENFIPKKDLNIEDKEEKSHYQEEMKYI